MFTQKANDIFRKAIADYHVKDNIETPIQNPFEAGTIEATLYHKCWIDTVQWHFEDIIRDPDIDPKDALVLKRRIDKSNQDRTDMVEDIDTYFRELYKDVKVLPDATINTDGLSTVSLSLPSSCGTCLSRLSALMPLLSISLPAELSLMCSSNSRTTSLQLLSSCLLTSRLAENT